MNRRKALWGIALFSGTAYAGYQLFDTFQERDLHVLEANKSLIAELAEMIIPQTDTPGAKDTKSEEAILVLLKDCADKRTRNNFIKGLEEVNGYARSNYNKEFVQCDQKQKVQIMVYFERKNRPYSGFWGKIQKKAMGSPFFSTLKEYTTRAYCTSMGGATQGLAYLYIPSKRMSCIDIAPNQKSWATQ